MNTQALVDFKAVYDARTEARNKIAEQMSEGLEKEAFIGAVGSGLLNLGGRGLMAAGRLLSPASRVAAGQGKNLTDAIAAGRATATAWNKPYSYISGAGTQAGRKFVQQSRGSLRNVPTSFRSDAANALQRGGSWLRDQGNRFAQTAGGKPYADAMAKQQTYSRAFGQNAAARRTGMQNAGQRFLSRQSPTEQFKNLYAAAPGRTIAGTGLAAGTGLGSTAVMANAMYGGGGNSGGYSPDMSTPGGTYMPGSRGGAYGSGAAMAGGYGGAAAPNPMISSPGVDLNRIRNRSPWGVLGEHSARMLVDPLGMFRDTNYDTALRTRLFGDRMAGPDRQIVYDMMYPEEMKMRQQAMNNARQQQASQGAAIMRNAMPSTYGFQ